MNPKENRTQIDQILIEQFVRKGYKCEEIAEQNSTIVIITHGKKHSEASTQIIEDLYKNLLKTN